MRAFLRNIPTMMAIVVGSTSFLLSYVALRDVAASTGAVSSQLAWAVPICIDGGILAASAAIWQAAVTKRRRDLLAFATVIVLLGTSVMINIQHAGPSLTAKWIAALPPVILLACLELVASSHRHRLAEDDERQDMPAETLTAAEPALEAPAGQAAVVERQRPAAPLTATEPDAKPTPAHEQAEVRPTETAAPVVRTDLPETDRGQATPGTQARTPAPAQTAATQGGGRESTEPEPEPAPNRTRKPLRVQAEAPEVPAADRIREAFDERIAAGVSADDSSLAADIAASLDVSPTYVRRIIKPLREALTAQPS